jgi:hypothetical protein
MIRAITKIMIKAVGVIKPNTICIVYPFYESSACLNNSELLA